MADAKRILEQPDHLLDEDDEDSIIRVRPLVTPARAVLVTGESKMSARMMRNYFKRFGEVEKVAEQGDDKLQFVVTFTNAEGMCKIVLDKSIVLDATQSDKIYRSKLD